METADAALNGRFRFFSRWWADLGNRPDWLFNPVDGIRYPGDVHWTFIPDLSPDLGDIKYVWEPSRFVEVYHFVRAYAVTGDERYPEGFWSHVEAWIKANPPELGPNWRCGQEIAIRSFAWIFGLFAFRHCKVTTARRVAMLLKNLWYNAWHIERNHWYALRCVRNNHALSEAAGLFTIGTLFPFFKEAARWKKIGWTHLVSEALWQIYPDGTYMQHSTNYSRLVVQVFTWSLRVAQANELKFPEKLYERLRGLVHFLCSLQEETTGRVPNYGSNDGALIFPLSSCDYLDYRPALNALSVALDGKRLYLPGPWDEEAAWFTGPGSTQLGSLVGPEPDSSQEAFTEETVVAQREDQGIAFPVGGYYVIRGQGSLCMIRCGRYRHRPSQADMLHLDFWYNGHNVLADPGTYSYNPRGGWTDYFVGTSSHNTVTVDGQDQMKKGQRFLWSGWVQGRTLEFARRGSVWVFVGEHDGYAPVVHRRTVAYKNGAFLVIDDLFGDKKEHDYTLHWLVGDLDIEHDESGALVTAGGDRFLIRVGCNHESEGEWAREQENPKRGWQSLYYGEKVPAWSYRASVKAEGPVRFFTYVGLAPLAEPVLPKLRPLTVTEVDSMLAGWGLNPLGPIGGSIQ
ncbi:MAG: alginate lyase family protein [Bacteroidota bacterium]